MKRVIVTGASGFVGRAVVPELLKHGFETHAVTRHRPSDASDDIEWHQVDLFDAVDVDQLLDRVGASHLAHLAWCAQPPDYLTSPENERWFEASLHLVRRFAAHGGHHVLVSGTCFEYDVSEGVLVEGITPLGPTTPYGETKVRLQRALVEDPALADLSLVWARLFYLYGPYEHHLRLVPSVIGKLLARDRPQVSTGEQARDFLFVTDAARAMVELLTKSSEGAVNIASGAATPVRDVVRAIADELDGHDLIDVGARQSLDAEIPLIQGDVTRLKSILGWAPNTSIADGLSKTIEWWRGRLG